eukprot:13645539-Heterocapsa_arctica.AAC.1
MNIELKKENVEHLKAEFAEVQVQLKRLATSLASPARGARRGCRPRGFGPAWPQPGFDDAGRLEATRT